MGLFDFLKSKIKPSAEPKSFDEIFDLASKDVAYRPLFYRTLLEMELYVLTNSKNSLPKGEFTTTKEIKLDVKTFEDGKVPIFTSVDKIFENGVIQQQEIYVAMRARELFKIFSHPKTFLLNPFSRPSKELLPEEIQGLLNGNLFQPDEIRNIKAGTNISMGIPAVYPTNLAETIRKYCNTSEEIKGAYLALMHDSESNETPHLIIGLDVKGNLKQIFGEVGDIIKSHVKDGEPVDMINVSEESVVSNILRQKDHQIY